MPQPSPILDPGEHDQSCSSEGGAAQDITITGLTRFGIPAGGPVSAILGATGTNSSLSGAQYTATGLPPYGVRVYYAAGGAFKGNLHGDIQ